MITSTGVPKNERLPVLTLEEAQDLRDVLVWFGEGDDEWADEARHFAGELVSRVPSRECPTVAALRWLA
ncbi:hypothetical protein ACIRJS_26535 [Streptomyces sp. NPDC102340]|uniref:hypothetical protein n=1 Tax=unclassified Streptomyces TaxID=2593676 RepID=UPI003804DB67